MSEGATSLGSTTVTADGSWTFNVGKVSDADHTFTLSETDMAGNVSTSLLFMASLRVRHFGCTGNDVLVRQRRQRHLIGDGGADVMSGGAGNDTFKYTAIADLQPGEVNSIPSMISFTYRTKSTSMRSAGFTANGLFGSTPGIARGTLHQIRAEWQQRTIYVNNCQLTVM